MKIACINRPASTSQKKINVNIQKKLRLLSGEHGTAGHNYTADSILASSEYGDDGMLPVPMKKWIGRTEPALTYATTTSDAPNKSSSYEQD